MPLRTTIGLAVARQVLVVLGIFGLLRPWVLISIAAIILILFHAEARRRGVGFAFLRASAPPRETVLLILFALLALYPPIAFDETLFGSSFAHLMVSELRSAHHPR